MKRQVTVCCASEAIKPGRHSRDGLICKQCRKPVVKLKPIQSGTWAKVY